MNKDDMTVRKSWNEFCDKNPRVCIETTKMIDTLFDVQGNSQYIYQDSKALATLYFWYILFLHGLVCAEIECTVLVALPKRPINRFQPVR